MRWAGFLFVVCLTSEIAATATPVSVIPDEVYHYREVTGNTVKAVEWRLRKGDLLTLTTRSRREQYVTVTDSNYDTRRWKASTADGVTDFTAKRDGRTIVVSGRFKGEPVKKVLAIDNCPWYQATSLSLREMIASGDPERLFWTIRCDTLTVHKLRAINKGVERLESADNMLHIRLTLPGLLAPFWKSDYWFALPEGVFFRFQGPSGPPGSPLTTVTRTAG